jgi:hypothetical protein
MLDYGHFTLSLKIVSYFSFFLSNHRTINLIWHMQVDDTLSCLENDTLFPLLEELV